MKVMSITKTNKHFFVEKITEIEGFFPKKKEIRVFSEKKKVCITCKTG